MQRDMNLTASRTPQRMGRRHQLSQNPYQDLGDGGNRRSKELAFLKRFCHRGPDNEGEDLMLAAPGSSRASRRAESSSLSEYTKAVNTEMTRTIHKLREIEHARTHAGHDENMMRVDAQKLLRATDRELKCISYKLSTVISDGEYHRLLQQRTENEIEAIESTPIYCKLFCRGELGPARFRVAYKSRGDLRVLVSTAHKMPNESES